MLKDKIAPRDLSFLVAMWHKKPKISTTLRQALTVSAKYNSIAIRAEICLKIEWGLAKMKSTKLITATHESIKNLVPERQARAVAEKAIYFILSVFISKGTAFGMYAPFGAAFLAAVPYENMFSSLLGTILGYILPAEINIGIRYISTAIAVCAIRWTLNDLPAIKSHKLFPPVLAFASTIATGLAVNISTINDFGEAAMYITEATLSGGAAYFFSESMQTFFSKSKKIKQADLVYICLTLFAVILSLASVTIGAISVGKVLSTLVVLFCARFLGLVGGSIAGTAAGVVLGLAASSPSYIMGAYAFGGLIAGLAASFGRFACCASFMAASLVISVQSANPEAIISSVYETLLASAIFLFLHEEIGEKFMGLFSTPAVSTPGANEVKDSVATKLESTSKALIGVSESINMVSEKLALAGASTFEEIYSRAVAKVCENCGLKTFCFSANGSDTADSISAVRTKLTECGKVGVEDFPQSLTKRCNRTNDIVGALNELHREALEKKVSQERVSQVRSFMSEQFSDIGLLLGDIAAEVKNDDNFDIELAPKIASELKHLDIIPLEVTCKHDKLGRVSIEFETNYREDAEIKKLALERRFSRLCGRKLAQPGIAQVADRVKIKLTERPIFDVQVGVAQHVCNGGTLCGDNYTHFYDGSGRMFFLLSDGMGTGGRAAVEGAMTCKVLESLVKAGINFKTALKITNSALMAKSEDEFLATVDLLCADLFTGNINVLKAGAPLTLLRKNDKVVKYAPSSLPIGILNDINIANCEELLTKDDRVLMFSDGAVSQGDEWLAYELAGWTCESAQDFASSLLDKATKNKNFDDDITIAAMKVLEC